MQLAAKEVKRHNVLEAINGVDTIYTYNGSPYDLPFFNASLGVGLASLFTRHELMYDCRRCTLYGGSKMVELQLGIPQQLQGMTGLDAVLLRHRYQEYGDQNASALPLQYNKEDVVNPKVLSEKLYDRRRTFS